jgi:hypothetical protein
MRGFPGHLLTVALLGLGQAQRPLPIPEVHLQLSLLGFYAKDSIPDKLQ